MRVDFLDTGQERPCTRSRPSKQMNLMNTNINMVQEDKRRRMQTVRSAQEATLEY